MFLKNNKEISIVSVEKHRILKHSIVWGMGDYSSVVAIRGEDGLLRHVELIGDLYEENIKIEENVMELKGAYVEVTKYSDGNYKTKVCI